MIAMRDVSHAALAIGLIDQARNPTLTFCRGSSYVFSVNASGHPFYVATLFLPQVSSKPKSPHPLIVAYLKAALSFHNSEKTG